MPRAQDVLTGGLSLWRGGSDSMQTAGSETSNASVAARL
jgi:hypothetical protein